MSLGKRIKFEVWKTSHESVKFNSVESTMISKLGFYLKKNAYSMLTPRAQRVNASSQYILHRKWPLTCILHTHKKSYKLDEGVMLFFVLEKNRPLLLTKAVVITNIKVTEILSSNIYDYMTYICIYMYIYVYINVYIYIYITESRFIRMIYKLITRCLNTEARRGHLVCSRLVVGLCRVLSIDCMLWCLLLGWYPRP